MSVQRWFPCKNGRNGPIKEKSCLYRMGLAVRETQESGDRVRVCIIALLTPFHWLAVCNLIHERNTAPQGLNSHYPLEESTRRKTIHEISENK